jgi:hypothetical protein
MFKILNNISFSLLFTSSLALNLLRLTDSYFREAVFRIFTFRESLPQHGQDDSWLMSLSELVAS